MYCRAPFVAKTVSFDASVKPCPHFHPGAGAGAGEETIKRLREHYATSAAPHEGCARCRDCDRLEIPPRRALYDGLATEKGLQWLDLRLSNLCNFRCRSCSSDFSSRWIEDDARIEGAGFVKGAGVYYEPQFGALREALASPTLDTLELKGGEPMLALKTFLKDGIPETRVRALKITTNGSVIGEPIAEFFRRFENVEIRVSVDYVRPAYKPMRGYNIGAIEKFLDWSLSEPNVRVVVQTVISAYNLLELPHIIDWHRALDRNRWVGELLTLELTNFLHVPAYLSPFALAPRAFRKVHARLARHLEDPRYAALAPTVQLLARAPEPGSHSTTLERFTRELDRVRGERFWETLCDEWSHA